jgi:hypothetical protein
MGNNKFKSEVCPVVKEFLNKKQGYKMKKSISIYDLKRGMKVKNVVTGDTGVVSQVKEVGNEWLEAFVVWDHTDGLEQVLKYNSPNIQIEGLSDK